MYIRAAIVLCHCGTFCVFQSSRLILKSVEVNLYTDYYQLISLLCYLKYKPRTGCINLCMFSVCMSVCVAISLSVLLLMCVFIVYIFLLLFLITVRSCAFYVFAAFYVI